MTQSPIFEWDLAKNLENQLKHGVSFENALLAFEDPCRVVAEDLLHSQHERRYYCIGNDGNGNVLTVRFTHRVASIRIIGAGYWRRGRKLYEQKNKIHG